MLAVVACVTEPPINGNNNQDDNNEPELGVCADLGVGEVCRSATGPCDVEEVCEAGNVDCPADTFAAAGISCADGAFCNGEEACDGSGACLPGVEPCANIADGDDDCTEACDEASDSCDAREPEGTACDDGIFCNGSETCDASGVCGGSADAPAEGTACEGSGRACELYACQAGSCSLSAECPVHIDASEGTDSATCGDDWGSEACATLSGGLAVVQSSGNPRMFVAGDFIAGAGETLMSVDQDLEVYGGFLGGESRPEQRIDLSTHRNVLDANGEPSAVIAANDTTVLLDGFLLEGATGAALWAENTAGLTLRNLWLRDNVGTDGDGGAAMRVSGRDNGGAGLATVSLEAVTVSGNMSDATPAKAVVAVQNASLHIEASVFEQNSSSQDDIDGAALYLADVEATLQGSRWSDNSLTGSDSDGAALSARDSTLQIIECTFEDNSIDNDDGEGGAIAAWGSGLLTLSESIFVGNAINGGSARGGAVYVQDVDLEVVDSMFDTNVVDGTAGSGRVYGGAVVVDHLALDDGSATFDRSAFVDNVARAAPTGGDGARGGAIASEWGDVLDISGSDFSFNSVRSNDTTVSRGARGGAIFWKADPSNTSDTEVAIGTTYFRYNVADAKGVEVSGGAVALVGPQNVDLEDVEFTHNVVDAPSQAVGGALHFLSSSVATLVVTNALFYKNEARSTAAGLLSHGGAVFLDNMIETATLTNVSFVENQADSGAGGGLGADADDLDIVLRNVLFLDNEAFAAVTEAVANVSTSGTSTITSDYACTSDDLGATAGVVSSNTTDIAVSADPKLVTPSGDVFIDPLVCGDAGDNDHADAAWSGDWRQDYVANVDGALENATISSGYLRRRDDFWIKSLIVEESVASWEVYHGPSAPDCLILSETLDIEVPIAAANVAMGSEDFSTQGTTTAVELTCTLGAVTKQAAFDLFHNK